MDPRRAPRSVSVTITGLLVGLASFLGLVYTAFGVVDAGVPRMVVLGLSLVVAALVVFLVTTGGGRAARFAVASTIVLLAMAVTVYVAVQKPVQDDSAERPPAPSHLTSCGTLEDGRSVSGGWGPDRELFTIASPAPYPVMNSITDNPVVGDERAFFLVKQSVGQEDGGWCSSARVRDGDVLLFRIYVENSGAVMQGYPKDYNAARDVTVSVAVDDRAATLRTMTAYVSASNTNPQSVWCNLDLASPRPFRLDLISGSTEVYSNAARDNAEGKASGRTVPDLLSQPLLMGFEEDDGVVLPDYWYAKYIYFEMRVTEVS